MTEPDLLGELDAIEETRGPRCGVEALLIDLDANSPALAAQLRRALSMPKYKNTDIQKVLAKPEFGYRLASDTIGRHRRGGCRCPK